MCVVPGAEATDYRKRGDNPCSIDSGQRVNPLQRPLVEEVRVPVLTVADLRQTKASREHALRLEPQLFLLETHEAFHQQPRGDQQDERQRDLPHHQSLLRAQAPRPVDPAVSLLERFDHPNLRRLDSRSEPKKDARGHRDDRREDEGRPIQLDGRLAGQRSGAQAGQRLQGAEGHAQSQDTAHQSEDHALCECLPDDSTSRRAQRHPHGDLALASSGPGQEQSRDVGASDEQHQSNSTQKDPEDATHPAHQKVL
jgi:hypothetical protein